MRGEEKGPSTYHLGCVDPILKKHVRGSNTPEQSPPRTEGKDLDVKSQSSPSNAHLHSQAQVVAFVGIREALEARREEVNRRKIGKEQAEKTVWHK